MSSSFSYKQGFTLVEMMVVITIFTVITAVVLANMPAFRTKTDLDLLAQEVAVTIRQAQVFGVSTRSSGGTFPPSHGIHFGADNSFLLFADNVTVNNNYDGSAANCRQSGDECRELFEFRGGVYIDSIEGYTGSGWDTPTSLNILFKRPYVDAKFSDGEGIFLPYSRLKIVLKSARDPDALRHVMVWNTGHIYACNPANQSSCN